MKNQCKNDANLIQFLMHFWFDLGGILSYFSMKCWWLPAMFRPYKSIGPASKIEGLGPCWMSQKRPNSVQFFHWKIYTEISPNLKQKWWILGAKMEPKSIKKSMFFLIDFLEAPKTLRNHRGSSGGAPVELRGWHFLPAGSPEAANYQKI